MLENLITNIPDWENKTAEEIHAYLNEKIKTKTVAIYTWIGLRNLFPNKYLNWKVAITTAIEVTYKDNLPVRVALEDIMSMLSIGDGPDFSNDILQIQIDQLAQMQIISTDDAELLKALGYKEETNWKIIGGTGNIPSVESVSTAKTARIQKNTLAKKCNAARDSIDALLVYIQHDSTTTEIVSRFEQLFKANIGE